MGDFVYNWEKQEANFGSPISGEVSGGTHISIENILKYKGQYIALRRPEANPQHEVPKKAEEIGKPLLYFVHNLPRWGETMDNYINRVIKDYAGVGVVNYRVVGISMEVYEDTNQWAWTPYAIVELDKLPVTGRYGNEVTEVVSFTQENIPDEFGWWTKQELEEFLSKHDT